MNENNEVKVGLGAMVFVVIAIIALVGTTGYLYGKNSNTTATVPVKDTGVVAGTQVAKPNVVIEQVKELVNDKNIAFGDKNSKLIFVEFSDPSCPFCHVAAGKNGELNKKMGQQFVLKADGGTYVAPVPEIRKLVEAGKAAFVWLYANGHGSGELATVAQYCAKEKGKFWEVHDLLMSAKGYDLLNTTVKNDKTKSGVLAEFLKSAVDPTEMKACIDSGKYDNRLTDDMLIAKQFGFQGTPDFYVNTTNFSGAYSFTDMQGAVDAVLK